MEYKKLSEIAVILNGARLSRFNEINTKKQPVIKKLYSNNLFDYDLEDISEDLDQKFYTQKNDILINLAKPHTIIKIDKEGYIVPMSYIIVRVKPDYDEDYIYQILKNEIIPKKINLLTEGSILKTIRLVYLKEIKIPMIEIEKQIKLSKLLMLVEKRKSLSQKSIELTNEFEKSVLNEFLN